MVEGTSSAAEQERFFRGSTCKATLKLTPRLRGVSVAGRFRPFTAWPAWWSHSKRHRAPISDMRCPSYHRLG